MPVLLAAMFLASLSFRARAEGDRPGSVMLGEELDSALIDDPVWPMRNAPGLDRPDHAVLEMNFLQQGEGGEWARARVPRIEVARIDPETGRRVLSDWRETAGSIDLTGERWGSRGPDVLNWPVLPMEVEPDHSSTLRAGRTYQIFVGNDYGPLVVSVPQNIQPGERHVVYVPLQRAASRDPMPRPDPPVVIRVSAEPRWWRSARSILREDEQQPVDRRVISYAYGLSGRDLEVGERAPDDGSFVFAAQKLGGEFAILAGGGGYAFPLLYRRRVVESRVRLPGQNDVVFTPSKFREYEVLLVGGLREDRREPAMMLYAHKESPVPLFFRRLSLREGLQIEGAESRTAFLCQPGRYWVRVEDFFESGSWEGEVTFPADGEEPVEVRIAP